MSIIPMYLVQETGESLREEMSPEEAALEILAEHFPRLCNDIAMLVQRPFRLHWDPSTQTASTDCKAEICLAPWFFLEGQVNVGYGTAYHEAGHILSSPYGVDLLREAERVGGETLRHIVNIVLDRKDDILTARHAPGFAPTLRERLAYICTMTRRQTVEVAVVRRREAIVAQRLKRQLNPRLVALRKKHRSATASMQSALSQSELTALLKSWKPTDPYEDFFFAAKWHKAPRLKVTHKAMTYLSTKRLLKAKPAELLWICQQIHRILGEPLRDKRKQSEVRFNALALVAMVLATTGSKGDLSAKTLHALARMVKRYVETVRGRSIDRLLQRLKNLPIIYPGPLSVGSPGNVPIRTLKGGPQYVAAYQEYLSSIRQYVQPLVKNLRRLDSPSEFTIYGQDEGELDLAEAARIATGLPGYYMETVTERNIDAELHLAIDCSGSMIGSKVEQAKQITTLFSEGILSRTELCGHLWSFNSEAICDLGAVSRDSAFVSIGGAGGNSDTHMLRHVGAQLAKSKKRRKVLLVLADDGPDNMELAAQASRQLMARGIVVIHLLVGVHGTPDIYPFELIYISMEDCLSQFGDLLESIIKHLK